MSTIGNIVGRLPIKFLLEPSADPSAPPRVSKKGWLILAAVCVLIIGSVVFFSISSDAEKKAIEDSRKAAAGFEEDSDAYTFTQLNEAVKLAADKKCGEARAVFGEAVKNAKVLPETDMQSYKKRIDDLCSGNASQPAKSNQF